MDKRWRPPEFDKDGMTRWHWKCQHPEKLALGIGTDIGSFTYINALKGVVIEEDVQIGSHCSIYTVSTIDDKEGQICIRKRAKIGTHSVVMPGVTIGESAVVGAFSFVNRDVEPFSVGWGQPYRRKGMQPH